MDLEKHLVEAWDLATGLLFQFDRQHTRKLRIGEALHRPEVSRRAVAGEALNVVLSIRSGQMGYKSIDRSLFARRRFVLVGIKNSVVRCGDVRPELRSVLGQAVARSAYCGVD
jgi:hypothetical protein